MTKQGAGPGAAARGRLPRIEADPSRPLALALDSSGPVEVLAVVQGPLVLGQIQARRSRSDGDTLVASATRLLASLGRSVQDVSVVACVIGPGAFTGIRVGIATAEGLSDGLGIPALGYLATDGWAWAVRDCGAEVAVTLDARRGEVYTALYETAAGVPPGRVGEVELQSPRDWFGRLAERGLDRVRLVGDGALLYADLAREVLGEAVWMDPFGSRGPDLVGIAQDALGRLDGGLEDPKHTLRPLYLREHDGSRSPAPSGS
ncbi:MAG TPA: tRNA (adenosine(37)-N6)-threonylcarbamoyltransferase complex dimerization subunit type 1 TsaB [Deltaproteobacteria bacterium]|nr:tRNA (adenosine(37)-N6)-threonylcarbamoyltransferase complex dimerization subunit type 1 TsaB [Deltaproteobacteria bacterium]HCP46082.1 tRNA (adenosine(37)-N6)-threonylcarbamoyltransferase complex dimerization subunit type 1 TsaB [Deltaproteobacteria bacterium]